MHKPILAIALMALLGGCSSLREGPWSASQASCNRPTADQEFALNVAGDLANEGRLHASLANLEGLPDSLVDVRLNKARVLRLLGEPGAQQLYTSLLGTCREGEGEHGLGQLAAARGDNDQALAHLQRAVRLSPTDEKVRNDLGVVYLNRLQVDQARFQFLTAIELKQNDSLAAQNLVTLLLYQDDWSGAAQLVSRTGLSPQQFNDARTRAEQLRRPVARQPAPVRIPVKPERIAAVGRLP